MEKPLKILVVTTAFPRHERDVISPWLVKELLLLKERGHTVKVFTSSYKAIKQRHFKSIEIYRFRYAPAKWETLTHDMAVPERMKQGISFKLLVVPYLLMGFVKAVLLASEERFDVVHVHWPVPHIIFALPFKLLGHAKIAASVHGSELALLYRLKGPIGNFFVGLLSHSDVIFANSTYTMKRLKNANVKSPIEILPLGNPHESTLYPYSEKEEANILFVGRLIEVKRVPILLKAFVEVLKKHPDARLEIVGDGPLMNQLVEMAQELGISEKVTFSGFLTGEPLKEAFQRATMLVLPSILTEQGETEGLGVVLIEALSFGVPIIGSNIGGIPDIIIDGRTGLLFEPGDYEDLAVKINLLIEDPNLRRKLVIEGQKHIIGNFSWDAIIDKLEKKLISITTRNSV
ncbi:MAG: glycosyltransferase family 4 protein [Candidatus Hydrothermia bacterium]